jgi:hypothetical protein
MHACMCVYVHVCTAASLKKNYVDMDVDVVHLLTKDALLAARPRWPSRSKSISDMYKMHISLI